MDLETILEKEATHHNPSVNNYRLTGTLYEEGLIYDFIESFEIPNKFKVVLKLPDGGDYQEGFNGEKAWEEDQYLIGYPAMALESAANWPNPLIPLKDFSDRGFRIDYLGLETIDGTDYFEVELELFENMLRQYYLTPDTCLISRFREYRKIEESSKPLHVETIFGGYSKYEGINFPVHIYDQIVSEEDSILVDIQWEVVETDLDFPTSYFDSV